ncbi:MAG: hypothetical protein BWY72_01117 [Bacteroidetes bacterium ADurb.Bin416]|nr:MAG: hypothetical protein BWY72_01117 [Bacteroidetes bacterium ADurb.Bin416]
MYRQLFRRLWQVLRFPAPFWASVAEVGDDKKTYQTEYFYPLAGMAALTAFISAFFDGDLTFKQQLSEGIQLFILSFGSILLGLFLAAWVLDKLFVRLFGLLSDYKKAEILVVYTLTPVLVVSILTRLFSELWFLKALFLYVFVIAWEAATHFYAVHPKQQGYFTLYCGAVVLLAPQLVEFILVRLLPGLN